MYTVIGAFEDRPTAQRTVDTLVVRGFPRDSIDLQARPDSPDPTADLTSSPSVGSGDDSSRGHDEGFIAGVRHFFASLFGTDDDPQAGIYSEAIRRGSTIITVDARDESEAERAADVMREQGGVIDLDARSRSWQAEGTTHAATGGTAGAMAAQALSDDDRIAPTARTNRDRMQDATTRTEAGRDVVMPVVREEVEIGKRAVEQGGVRVVRRDTETPVSELVRLRDERARIERRPADRAASTADLENFREGTVEDTVRRTDVEIDRLARQADDSLARATGDAYDEDADLGRVPNTTPRTGERDRTQTPLETRRKT